MLAPFLIIAVLTITSITLGSSLAELANTEDVCNVYWLSTIVYIVAVGFGGGGTAIYRLILVKYESIRLRLGPKKLMVIVLIIQNVAAAATVVLYYATTLQSETGAARQRITAEVQRICTKSDVTQLLCFALIFNEKHHFFGVKSPTITATPRVRD